MITDGYRRYHARIYPPGLFLFADRRILFVAEDFLDYGWQDGSGQRHRLMDRMGS